MAQSVRYAIAAAGPVAFGALRDVSGSWTLPLTITAALIVILCITTVLYRTSRHQFLNHHLRTAQPTSGGPAAEPASSPLLFAAGHWPNPRTGRRRPR
jgi:hypothetical protein